MCAGDKVEGEQGQEHRISDGDGCKIFYHGEDGRRNGIGVVLKEDYIGRVLEMKRGSDKIMYI